jgi:hypothetical protein
MSPNSWRLSLGLCLLPLLCALVHANPAMARTITSVEPSSGTQGDTLMLTIKGMDLPVGSVIVDFFPQQIAVLGTLSATETEVLVQVKIPPLANPGLYNISIYNQLGEDVFATGLFTVVSSVLTPIFRSYDPKAIAQADDGFALILSGESISPGAAEHLSMQWLLGDQTVGGLETTFSYGGSKTIACTVAGTPPTGLLKGRVLLDGKPIYQLEVQIGQGTASIVAHSPDQLALNAAPYRVRIIGSGMSMDYITRIDIGLSSDSISAVASDVRLIDGASIEASFPGPLPEGVYRLAVMQAQAVLYEGTFTILPAIEFEESSELLDFEEPELASTDEPAAELTEEPVPPDIVDAPGSEEIGPAVADPVPTLPVPAVPETEPASVLTKKFSAVLPEVIPADGQPCRFIISAEGASPEVAARLRAEMELAGEKVPQLMSGVFEGGVFVVFAPSGERWPAGATGTLTLSDPAGEYEDLIHVVNVDAPVLLADGPSGEWKVERAFVNTGRGGSVLTVNLTGPGPEWDSALLSGNFTLAPLEPGYQSFFSNLTLKGDLTFRRSDAGVAIGTCAGNFVPGYLLLNLRYSAEPPMLSTHELDCALPKATLIAPQMDRVVTGEGSGGPRSLRWVVDFAPLVVAEPSLVTPRLVPEPGPDGYTVAVSGTTLEVLQDTGKLASGSGASSIDFSLEAPFKLDWQGVESVSLPLSAEAPETSVAINSTLSLEQQEIQLTDTGFTLTLETGPAPIPSGGWQALKLTSSNLLLQANIGKFTVTASAAGTRVMLAFNRSVTGLPDAAWELLMAELVSSSPVDIELEWVSDGTSMKFSRPFVQEMAEPAGRDSDAP